MTKKHGMPPSALYVQTVAEQRTHLAGKVRKVLDDFERHHRMLSPWQSNQLNYAIGFIADGLFDLALCELDALAVQRGPIAKGNDQSLTISDGPDIGTPAIAISRLRQQLLELA